MSTAHVSGTLYSYIGQDETCLPNYLAVVHHRITFGYRVRVSWRWLRQLFCQGRGADDKQSVDWLDIHEVYFGLAQLFVHFHEAIVCNRCLI